MVWQTGETIHGGKYRILGKLAEGGFGITYRAQHLQTGLEVVIKTPNDRLMGDPKYREFLQKFQREVKILGELANLRHPHIVRIYDSFQEGHLPCLVMELIRGQTLLEKGKLSEQDALTYIAQIGSALQAIHGQNNVHRDIHPSNIVITPDNQAVLVDFGLVAEIIPTTVYSEVYGHPAYEAPELRRGSRDPLLDIYALSGTLYFALTGKDPRWENGELQFEQWMKPQIRKLIQDGMSVHTSKRPKDMQAWLKRLPNAPQNDGTSYLPQSPWEKFLASGLRVFLGGIGINGTLLNIGGLAIEGSWNLGNILADLGGQFWAAIGNIDLPWKILRVPFGIWTVTGYFSQTVNVVYGVRLSFYLWAKSYGMTYETFIRADDWTGVDVVGVTISCLVAELIVGGVGYFLFRILFPKSDATVDIALNATVAVALNMVLYVAAAVVFTMIMFVAAAMAGAIAGAMAGTAVFVVAMLVVSAVIEAGIGTKEELRRLKPYSPRQYPSQQYILLITSSWVAGCAFGWLLYHIFPLFYIELPSGL